MVRYRRTLLHWGLVRYRGNYSVHSGRWWAIVGDVQGTLTDVVCSVKSKGLFRLVPYDVVHSKLVGYRGDRGTVADDGA